MTGNSLFGEMAMPEVKPPVIPECEPWNISDLLEREKEVVGIYISAHPLDGFKFELDHYGFLPINQLDASKGKSVRLAGYVSDAQHRSPRRAPSSAPSTSTITAATRSSRFGKRTTCSTISFWRPARKYPIQGVWGEHPFRPGVMEFKIQRISLLSGVRKAMTKRISIGLSVEQLDEGLVSFLTQNVKSSPGNTELCIQIRDDEAEHKIRLRTNGEKFYPDDAFVGYLAEREIPYHVELV